MPITQRILGAALGRLPKFISPAQHAFIDYAMAATFLAAGAALWKRHRRAGISAFLCGSAAAVNGIITDYPGGLFPMIDFETHGQVDASLAGITIALPRLMGFSSDRQSRFFDLEATLQTAAATLTDYGQGQAGRAPIKMPDFSRKRRAA